MKSHTLFAALLAAGGLTFAQENLLTWANFKVISVDTRTAGLLAPVTKFPLLIRLNASNASDIFSGASAGGADVRISNAAGTQVLSYEIEHWDVAGQQAAIWVLADTVKSNDSSVAFRIYWNRPAGAASASSGPSVFDTANSYIAAWHLGNGTGNIRPASTTAAPYAFVNNGGNGASVVTGVIGKADSLAHITGTGSEDAANGVWIDLNRDVNGADIGASARYNNFTTGFSYSIWIRPNGFPTFYRMLAMAPDPVSATNRMVIMGNVLGLGGDIGVRWTSGCAFVDPPSSNPCNINNGSLIADQAWSHIFVTKAAGSTPMKIYVNGDSVGASGNIANATANNRIGWIGRAGEAGGSNNFFTGLVDNVTLSKAARSRDFVKISYETQKAGASVVLLGSTQSQTPISVRGEVGKAPSFFVKSQGSGALFRIATAATASVSVTDVRGHEVWKASFVAGSRELAWDGRDTRGVRVSSGMYVARLTVLDKQGRAITTERRIALAR